MRFKSQISRDSNRDIYVVTFPADLASDRVLAWLRSVSGSFPHRPGFSLDSIVFETVATSRGILHRLHVPSSSAEHMAAQLRTLAPGITVAKDEPSEPTDWTYGVEVGMSSPARQLRIPSHDDLAASILASVQTLRGDEQVLIQWVVSPAPLEKPPIADRSSKSSEFSVFKALTGRLEASHDEIDDRRKKLAEQNVLAIGRIMASAETDSRARLLVGNVRSSISAAHSPANQFTYEATRIDKLSRRANNAETPLIFPGQFNLTELGAVLAWPIGSPFVAGLPQGSTRHLYATEDIPSSGIVLGDSNYPGHERPIAVGFDQAFKHCYIGGRLGSGKSVMMANHFAQVVRAGYGAVVIDAGNSDSNETLFSRVLNLIPYERMNDVIVMNPTGDFDRPTAFNLLDQGNPRVVADQIRELIAHLYQETSGVWTKQLLFHGLYTLAERPGLTIYDLMPLLNRQTPAEQVWADELVRSVKDRELRNFWQRWENYSQSERDRYSQPIANRIWQIVGRPEVRNIVGQPHSSFQMKDVLNNNKILLVSLNKLPQESSEILGTLIMNAVWSTAQSMEPKVGNFLYLDEFQVMTKLPIQLDDLLRQARKHKLGAVLGTQFIGNLTPEMKRGIINSTATRVIFQTSSEEARVWRDEFGRRTVDENDFMRIRRYEAVAQLTATSGMATAVTLHSRDIMPSSSSPREVNTLSRAAYGHPLDEVERDMETRRHAQSPTKKKPSIGTKPYDD